MPLIAGAVHAVSGTGQFSVASPSGLRVVLADVPVGLGQVFGTPPVLVGAGRVTLGNALGWLPSVRVEHGSQLVLGIPADQTVCGYQFVQGATATITELLGPPTVNYIDRNPLVIVLQFGGTNAPHVTTVRWVYTVPANRKAMLELASASGYCVTVNTTPGVAFAQIRIQHVGGVASGFMRTDAMFNAIGQRVDGVAAGLPALLTAGDVIDARTNDTGVGGAINWNLFAKLTEFDAG